VTGNAEALKEVGYRGGHRTASGGRSNIIIVSKGGVHLQPFAHCKHEFVKPLHFIVELHHDVMEIIVGRSGGRRHMSRLPL
jgi:hypothetical protein